jgi:uncharacterized protein (DUF1778 family)
MTRAAQRQERISLRVSLSSKRRLERAAAYSEKTLTDFVVDEALRRADTIVREREVISLAADEWGRLQKLLVDPPKPNRRSALLAESLMRHRIEKSDQRGFAPLGTP